MRIEPSVGEVSIVLLGNFNPPIFSPDWLARNQIVGSEDAEQAVVSIIHDEIAQFLVAQSTLVVERERFSITTQVGPFVRALDIVQKTFRDVLPHTPLRAFGVNRSVHFSVGSGDRRNDIGRALAPPEAWGEWTGEITKGKGSPLQGGMVSIQMQSRSEIEKFSRKTTATVQPSVLPQLKLSGIFAMVNDHFDPKESVTTTQEFVDTLASEFEASITHSEWIIDQVMALRDYNG